MRKKRYIPDLNAFMASCEINFAKMLKLLPSDLSFGTLEYRVNEFRLLIENLEHSRYTLTLRLIKEILPGVENCGSAEIVVRLYFDVKVAEVIKYQGVNRLKPSYPYPNDRMYQKDEKQQANEFLGEWLSFCLNQGYFSDRKPSLTPQ
ncbi:MAG: DUF1249 domain-containing protein [Pseudomonadota bacterium]